MNAPATPLLSLLALNKRYETGAVAVHRVDLDVMPGEFLTLLGPSGSGKTSILKMIAGFEAPTGGDIRIDGRSVLQQLPHEREIGMVFQNYALFPHLSVEENIAFPLDLRSMPKAEIRRRVERILGVVRLHELGGRYPHQLSGGQQQRVALARAVVFEPRMVLMDEPLGALDRNLRARLTEEIKRVQRELGMTVVYVTHDQDEALILSDRIAVMRDGRLEQVAGARDLYRRPRNRFVATFVGESNLLAFERVGSPGETGKLRLEGGVGIMAASDGDELPDAGWVLIRPEMIDIGIGIAPADAAVGTVRDVVFLGELTRYTVETGNRLISVKLQNRRSQVFESGQSVWLRWHPEDAITLVE
jgi:putative spermidine/putrescine transport system ATP-binding protein